MKASFMNVKEIEEYFEIEGGLNKQEICSHCITQKISITILLLVFCFIINWLFVMTHVVFL